MLTFIISVLSVYFFILLGFVLKKKFGEQIDNRSMTIMSIYGLSPILCFWGIMMKPLDLEFVMGPVLYLGVTLSVLLLSVITGPVLFRDRKEQSIFTVSPLIGNTGNLGTPLAILLFGTESVFYANAIGIANIFFVYTVGIFFYSLGNHTIKASMLNIAKMPVIWAAIVAILLNLYGVKLSEPIMHGLQMGAYASMTIQLLLFGIFLGSVTIRENNLKLTVSVMTVKFLLIPLTGLFAVSLFEVSPLLQNIVLLQLCVPLALVNATLATLYGCKPNSVIVNVLVSMLIFIVFSLLIIHFSGVDL